jgi:glycerol-3-phosphate acyltransferase PlsY
LPLSGLAGNNPASCRAKNTPTPHLFMAATELYKIISVSGLPILVFLLGSIPWGLVIARGFTAIDIRKQGSRNIGATNVARLAGIPLGLLTLVLDMFKGSVSVYLAMILIGTEWGWGEGYISFVALAVFLGHLFPVYTKFKNGGKGVATALGCFLIISPGASAIIIVIFFLSLWAGKRVSVGSLIASAALPAVVWLVTDSIAFSVCALTLAVLIYIRHQDNIKRLLSGTEPPFRPKPPR